MSSIYDNNILNIIALYSPIDIINLVSVKKDIKFDSSLLYKLLFKESDIPIPYTYPIYYNDIWVDAINNRLNFYSNFVTECNCSNHKVRLLKDGTLMTERVNSCNLLGPDLNIVNSFDHLGPDFESLKSVKLLELKKFCDRINKVTKIPNIKNIVQIACGDNIYILLRNGIMMSQNIISEYVYIEDFKEENENFEANIKCMMKSFDKNKFIKVPNIKYIIQISQGNNYIFILLKDGTIMSFGNNDFGQLGLGNNIYQATFTKVPDIKDVVKIFCGKNYTYIILKDGSIMSCGDNKYGQLGIGNDINQNKFTVVTNEDGSVLNNVINITCDKFFTHLLLKNGSKMTCSIKNKYRFLLNPYKK